MNKIIMMGAVAAFGAMVAACDSPKPIAQVNQDVAAARSERSSNVADARREGNQAINAQQRDVNEAQANKDYEVAMAKADGDYDVATKACNALAGTAQADCKDHASAMLKADKANAELLKPRG
ncbi:MAG: hypothetical protein ABI640_00240 [Gammaproteobacteria bacterium]